MRLIAKGLLILGMVYFSLASARAQDNSDKAIDDIDGAISFIETLASSTQDVWGDTGLTSDERTAAFRQLFEDATDVELLSKAMLGRHYRTASAGQRRAYLATMQDYIITEFDKRMSQIGFKKLNITGTTPASGKRGHVFVRTKVLRDDGDPILADWRVRKKQGQFQIVNLEVEGINLLITNREVFSARIKEIGLDGLIDELRQASESYYTEKPTGATESVQAAG